MKQKRRNWLFALVLTTPMIIFFAAYLFNHAESIKPTGFIQYDNISYIAYAKQYLDTDRPELFYTNPFNDSENYTSIYFQTQTIFFALLLKLGVPPGWILIPFTIICSLICFRLLISIYDHIIPYKKYRSITLWLFAWGGGILTLGGFILQQVSNDPAAGNIFVLDPGNGWWGLNFGRSLFFSCEAYYHALFLASIYFILKQKTITYIWPIATVFFIAYILYYFFKQIKTGTEDKVVVNEDKISESEEHSHKKPRVSFKWNV